MGKVVEDQTTTTPRDSASDSGADTLVSPVVDFLLLFGVVLVGALLLIVLL